MGIYLRSILDPSVKTLWRSFVESLEKGMKDIVSALLNIMSGEGLSIVEYGLDPDDVRSKLGVRLDYCDRLSIFYVLGLCDWCRRGYPLSVPDLCFRLSNGSTIFLEVKAKRLDKALTKIRILSKEGIVNAEKAVFLIKVEEINTRRYIKVDGYYQGKYEDVKLMPLNHVVDDVVRYFSSRLMVSEECAKAIVNFFLSSRDVRCYALKENEEVRCLVMVYTIDYGM